MDLVLIKVSFCRPSVVVDSVNNETNIITFKEINNYLYYNNSNNTLNVSMSLSAQKREMPYLICAVFYPFFALQSILITSLNNTSLLDDKTYYIGDMMLNSDTTIVNELFFPHIFHWDSNIYTPEIDNPNVKMSYSAYSIYFILTYFYIFLFLVLALISRKINKINN